MSKTLLEKAKDKGPKNLTEAELDELALAWVHDDIKLYDCMRATGKGSSGMYILLARALKRVMRKNMGYPSS